MSSFKSTTLVESTNKLVKRSIVIQCRRWKQTGYKWTVICTIGWPHNKLVVNGSKSDVRKAIEMHLGDNFEAMLPPEEAASNIEQKTVPVNIHLI